MGFSILMEQAYPYPTKAELEFDGDCFGKFPDPSVTECQICLVFQNCKDKLKGGTNDDTLKEAASEEKGLEVPEIKGDEEMAANAKEKVEKKEKAKKTEKPVKETPPSSPGNKWRPLCKSWAAYEAIRNCDGEFTFEEALAKFHIVIKEYKIKTEDPNGNVYKMLNFCKKSNTVTADGKKFKDRKYKNVPA